METRISFIKDYGTSVIASVADGETVPYGYKICGVLVFWQDKNTGRLESVHFNNTEALIGKELVFDLPKKKIPLKRTMEVGPRETVFFMDDQICFGGISLCIRADIARLSGPQYSKLDRPSRQKELPILVYGHERFAIMEEWTSSLLGITTKFASAYYGRKQKQLIEEYEQTLEQAKHVSTAADATKMVNQALDIIREIENHRKFWMDLTVDQYLTMSEKDREDL